jgi:hypothetical protein
MSESTSSTPSVTPTPTRPTVSAEALNRAADESRTARASAAARTPAPAPVVKAAAKAPKGRKAVTPARTPAPPVKAPTGRKALTPAERAARPVTTTIAAYVAYLGATIPAGTELPGVTGPGRKFGKLSARERALVGLSITLYGSYQISPDRRKARLG